ncbi:uncharacterized protein [Littorina saxatilis]|uniref:TIR domain-containing protein n=1 Tax=Littorina saxatilis TaxID=31220 RepID=A0AAN9GEV9_9CAEN
MGLVLKDSMRLTTALGISEVQLLFGDITQLPIDEKVDFIFVSAFPGDYTPVSGTMVYALKKNFDLKLGKVAQTKEADLRRRFNCWVSKPLSDHMPYKRLVCFERMNRFEGLPDQISGLFRAMMAVFNNEDKTVITPLLATGNQGNSDAIVLRAIVKAACHWIKAGLPLRCLKIVIYTDKPQTISGPQKNLLGLFAKQKMMWENSKYEEEKKTEQKKFDVCLSYSEKDAELASRVCKDLQKVHGSIVIHKEQFSYNHEEVWQEQIFTVMVQSYKIVAILTPSYVDEVECLEQYNLALCCNRLTGAEVLAPFYLQTIDAFPSYMALIQYSECRVRKEGETAEEKMLTACTMLIKEIDKDKFLSPRKSPHSDSKSVVSSTAASKTTQPSKAYDIFISYSHRNPKEVFKLYENLLDLDPDLCVFLDRSELNTGNIWQETLYEALDSAKVVIAFITKGYMESTVCQEEYNIALARFLSEENMCLLPLLMDSDIKEIPAMYSAAWLVDMSNPSKRYEEQYCRLAEVPIEWLKKMKKGHPVLEKFCNRESEKTRISHITMKWREKDFKQRFLITGDKDVQLQKAATTSPQQKDSTKTVVFSFAKDSLHQASIISHHLQKQDKIGVKCEFLNPPKGSGVQAPKLQLLDSADMIVLIVSDDYLASNQHRHELHIALGRQRTCKDRRILYLMESFHTGERPVYAQLFHYSVNIVDELWTCVASDVARGSSRDFNTLPHQYLGLAQHEALHAAALDITDKLIVGNTEGSSGMPTNIVNLVSLRDGKQGNVPVCECSVIFSSMTGLDLTVSQSAGVSADPPDDEADVEESLTVPADDTEKGHNTRKSRSVPETKTSMNMDQSAKVVLGGQKLATNSSSCQLL